MTYKVQKLQDSKWQTIDESDDLSTVLQLASSYCEIMDEKELRIDLGDENYI